MGTREGTRLGAPDPERLALAPEERRGAVVRAIAGARKRLKLSVFRCDDLHVLDAIAAALERGVKVEALMTRRSKGSRHQLKKLKKSLEGLGAEVFRYDDPVVKYHAKYLIADDGPAVIATLNFTRKCFEETFDAVLTTCDAKIVAGLQRLFESDRAGRQAHAPRRLPDRLILGPEHARERFAELLKSAERRIRIIDHKLDDPYIVALLKARRRAGVDVQVLGGGQLGDMRSHGKVLIVDGRTAVMGSMSMTALHLEFRREVAIVLTDRAMVSELDRMFEHALREQPAGAARLPFPEALA